MKRIKTLILVFFISSAQAIDDDILHMSFEETLPDTDVIRFIKDQNTKPTAYFMWVKGHNYSYRIYDESEANLKPEKLIVTIRERLSNMAQGGIDNDLKIIRPALTQMGKEDFVTNEGLIKHANFIISKVNQGQQAIQHFESDQPIIYGMEFTESTENLEQIREDDRVKIAHIKSEDLENGKQQNLGSNPEIHPKNSVNGIKPKKYQVYGHADYYVDLSTEEMWEKINELAQTGRIEFHHEQKN